jgi:hypothetical protein
LGPASAYRTLAVIESVRTLAVWAKVIAVQSLSTYSGHFVTEMGRVMKNVTKIIQNHEKTIYGEDLYFKAF